MNLNVDISRLPAEVRRTYKQLQVMHAEKQIQNRAKNDGETVRRFAIITDDCRGLGNRQKDNRPFLHYYDLDKKGYRYATNWEIL